MHVSLHNRSAYSFGSSLIHVEALPVWAAFHDMPAVALTDLHGLYGAVAFQQACAERGVKPIFGAELRIRPDGQFLSNLKSQIPDFTSHISHLTSHIPVTLLARSMHGYTNLCQLISLHHLRQPDGEKDAVTLDLLDLREHAEDLICLVGRLAEAHESALTFSPSHLRTFPRLLTALRDIFPDRLYVELAIHAPADVPVARKRAQIADELGIPVVATPEARCLIRGDNPMLRALASIGTLTLIDRPHPDKPEGLWHLRTPREMQHLFARRPDALTNTLKIADQCSVRLDLSQNRFPAFDSPDGRPAIAHLREICLGGCRKRYIDRPQYKGIGGTRPRWDDVTARLDRELRIIEQVQYAEYFLVFHEILEYCNREGIATLARGSAADSLVCYALGVSQACPFRFDLPFDRFVNPERAKFSKMADIDLDLPWDQRDQVIRWVYERWGSDRVAMIGTANTFHGRAALAELGKAYGLPAHEVYRATKVLPRSAATTLGESVKNLPEARDIPINEEPYRTILRTAGRLEGLPRHWAMHPCGIVISPEPLGGLVPVQRSPKGPLVAQYDMDAIEDLGFIKIDLLGQAGLSVLRDTVAEVKRTEGVDVDLERDVDYSEPETWDMIATGQARGVHHIESPAMTSLLVQSNCRDIDCLTTIVALIRPGAANQGKKELFCRRHQGFEPPCAYQNPPRKRGAPAFSHDPPPPRKRGAPASSHDPNPPQKRGAPASSHDQNPPRKRGVSPACVHPSIQPILEKTYGLMVFEEHILQIAVEFAGMNVGRADVLRRALNKENRKLIAEMREEFRRSALAHGRTPPEIDAVWAVVSDFAGFMFNKAHSAEYALEAFQGAWLKRRWPAHYLAAILSNYRGFYAHSPTLPQILYVLEALRLGARFLPPCVNRSRPAFAVERIHHGDTEARREHVQREGSRTEPEAPVEDPPWRARVLQQVSAAEHESEPEAPVEDPPWRARGWPDDARNPERAPAPAPHRSMARAGDAAMKTTGERAIEPEAPVEDPPRRARGSARGCPSWSDRTSAQTRGEVIERGKDQMNTDIAQLRSSNPSQISNLKSEISNLRFENPEANPPQPPNWLIRVPLSHIKGLPDEFTQRWWSERQQGEFTSITDFLARCRPTPSEAQLLLDAGALDLFGYSRPELFWHLRQTLTNSSGNNLFSSEGAKAFSQGREPLVHGPHRNKAPEGGDRTQPVPNTPTTPTAPLSPLRGSGHGMASDPRGSRPGLNTSARSAGSGSLLRDSYLAPTSAGIPSRGTLSPDDAEGSSAGGARGKGFPQNKVREGILAPAEPNEGQGSRCPSGRAPAVSEGASSAPKGLCPSAQGWSPQRPTLGTGGGPINNPNGVVARAAAAPEPVPGSPVGSMDSQVSPLCGQPHHGESATWAGGHNAVGVVRRPLQASADLPPVALTAPDAWARARRELELLEFPVTLDPFTLLGRDDKGRDIDWSRYTPVDQLHRHLGRRVHVCGIMVADRINVATTGELMKFVTLADRTGFVETILFPDTYRRLGHLAAANPIIVAAGIVEPFENRKGFTLRVQHLSSPARAAT